MHTLLTLVSFCVFFVWVSGNLNFIYQWQQQADSDQQPVNKKHGLKIAAAAEAQTNLTKTFHLKS